jgi:hypothetical protein
VGESGYTIAGGDEVGLSPKEPLDIDDKTGNEE